MPTHDLSLQASPPALQATIHLPNPVRGTATPPLHLSDHSTVKAPWSPTALAQLPSSAFRPLPLF